MKTFLRNATIEDTNAIANVYLRSRKELVAFAPLIHTDESIHQWIRNKLLLEEQVIVAEEEGIIVGMMSLKKTNDGIGRITQLYMHPDEVGHGVGTLMLTKAKSILGPPIHLYTFQENAAAIRFYERHGFQAIGFDDGTGNEENCAAILYEWTG